MMKSLRVKIFTGLILSSFAVFGTACGSAPQTAQTPRVRAAESPTPEYKPPKRVSRDVIKTEAQDDAVKVKTKQ